MARKDNNRYLIGLWAVVAALVVVLVVPLVATVATAKDVSTLAPVFGAAVGLVAVMGIRLWSSRRLERAFLQRGPEPLLRIFRGAGAKAMPNADAWGAYFEAWVYTLYGRFDSARQALARIEWRREPQLVQAAATGVEALLCYFDTREYARGLELARVARAAAEVSSKFPGAKTAMDSADSIVEIGRALSNEMKPDTTAKLAAQSRDLPFGARLIATWGLAAAHAQAGDAAQANEALARCRAMAPHCAPLCALPGSGGALERDPAP
jgi:hypothetical protein